MPASATSGPAINAVTRHMASDDWKFFPCQIGEQVAFIFYDHGVRDVIDQAPIRLVTILARFNNPADNGMPPNEEFAALSALENAIVAFAESNAGWFVGRITVDGHRHFYCYVDIDDEVVAAFIARAETQFGHVLNFGSRDDPDKQGYLKELFPEDRDWQVMKDLEVIESLRANGDTLAVERRVDHWAYFNDPAARDTFVQWAMQEGFSLGERLGPEGDPPQWGARLCHECLPQQDTISHYTLMLLDRAKELGGDYDGWETRIISSPIA